MDTETRTVELDGGPVEVTWDLIGSGTPWDRDGYAWTVTVAYDGRTATFDYYTGSLIGEPDAADILDALVRDRGTFYDYPDALALVEEYGYDPGEARKIWAGITENAAKLDALAGDAIGDLVDMVESWEL